MAALRKLLARCFALKQPKVKNGGGRAEAYSLWGQREHNSLPSNSARCQQPEPAAHLTLVIDCSKAMRGHPLAAVARGINFLLGFLDPRDSLTIYQYDIRIERSLQCEAQQFRGQLGTLGSADKCRRSSPSRAEDRVWLYDAIVKAVEDLDSLGQRPSTVKPLIVLSDEHQAYGAIEASDAKEALLWSELPHLHPILIGVGDPDIFENVRQTRTREVFAESTDDADLRIAFQVAGEHLQAILKGANEGRTTSEPQLMGSRTSSEECVDVAVRGSVV